jgi:glycosyltransferase involved in cell wall biosynthesis
VVDGNYCSVRAGETLVQLVSAGGTFQAQHFFWQTLKLRQNWRGDPVPRSVLVRLVGLVDQVFPAVLRRYPDATLTVVGSSPPAWLSDIGRKDRRIRVTGWVPDVSRWLDAAEVVVCPLRIGGGVKVKVLEALARGCAIVTTPVGMQGLRYLPRDSVMECQDLAVADACVTLLKSPARRDQARRARGFAFGAAGSYRKQICN